MELTTGPRKGKHEESVDPDAPRVPVPAEKRLLLPVFLRILTYSLLLLHACLIKRNFVYEPILYVINLPDKEESANSNIIISARDTTCPCLCMPTTSFQKKNVSLHDAYSLKIQLIYALCYEL